MNEQQADLTIKRTANIEHSLIAFTEWANRPDDQRFTSLEDLYAATKQRADVSAAFEGSLADCHVIGEGDELKAILPGFQGPTHFTNLGFQQLCTELQVPAGYMRRLPGDLAADNLNHAIAKLKLERDEQMITAAGAGEEFQPVERSFYHRSDTNQVQSVTSTSYGRIFDHEVVTVAQEIAATADKPFFAPKDWNGNVTGLFASDRDVWLYLIDGGSLVEGPQERDQLYRGIILSNSEVRTKAVVARSFMFRVTCGNLQIWGIKDMEEIAIIHRGNARKMFADVLVPRLREFAKCDIRSKMVEAVKAADSTKLPWSVSEKLEEFIDWAQRPARGIKFTRKEVCAAVSAALAEEGRCESIWDLVNGFTAVARDMKYAGDAADLSARAGKLMTLAQ